MSLLLREPYVKKLFWLPLLCVGVLGHIRWYHVKLLGLNCLIIFFGLCLMLTSVDPRLFRLKLNCLHYGCLILLRFWARFLRDKSFCLVLRNHRRLCFAMLSVGLCRCLIRLRGLSHMTCAESLLRLILQYTRLLINYYCLEVGSHPPRLCNFTLTI